MSLNPSEKDQRGLVNPEIVDLIQKHQDGERAEFLLLLDPCWSVWEDQATVLKAFEEKFNNYLDYILDGHFWAQYPQYKNTRAVITLVYQKKPEGSVAELIEAMKSFCFTVGVDLEVRAE